MKDKAGFEIRVGDTLRGAYGEQVVLRVDEDEKRFKGDKHLYEEHGIATEQYWTILRRADGSVPAKCPRCYMFDGTTTSPTLLPDCMLCSGTGSIDRRPEEKPLHWPMELPRGTEPACGGGEEDTWFTSDRARVTCPGCRSLIAPIDFDRVHSVDRRPAAPTKWPHCTRCQIAIDPEYACEVIGLPGVYHQECTIAAAAEACAAKAVDKHGRAVRAGDLYRDTSGLLNRTDRSMERASRGHAQGWALVEILSRGSPSDPVPDAFEPVRDVYGKPVLKCGGCGAEGKLTDALVSGVRSAICDRCRGSCIYPVVKRDTTPCPARINEREARRRYVAIDTAIRKRVAEVAPDVRLITDQVNDRENGHGILVAFKGWKDGECVWPLFRDAVEATAVARIETEFNDLLWTYLGVVGAKAMGGGR